MQNIIDDLLYTGLHVPEIMVKHSLVHDSLGENGLVEAWHGTNVLAYVLHGERCWDILALLAKN